MGLILCVILIFSGYAEDHFIVKLKEGFSPSSLSELNSKYRIIKVSPLFKRVRENRHGLQRIFLFYTNAQIDIKEIVKAYSINPLVEYAEPDYIGYGHAEPNDSYFGNQWHLKNTGQNPSGQHAGTPGCDAHATTGWDLETGSRDVIIGILDTGVDLDHPDITSTPSNTTTNLWKNYDEIPGNGIDDDGNGYIDDYHGWNFVSNNNNPQDDHGHGTINAGIIGARGNNGTGVSGVMWYVSLMPVKVLDSNNRGYYSWWAQGIQYAVDNGARVINMSMGGTSASSTLQDAVNYAWDNGALIVASMGNNNSYQIQYPAYYTNVIAVGATDNDDARCVPSPWCSFGSNYGDWLDVMAPGCWIYSTAWNDTYQYWSGTSMSAPQVAGLAGLILSLNPYLTNVDVKSIIENNADDLGASGFDIYYGYGRINIYNALSATPLPSEWKDEDQLTVQDGAASLEAAIAAWDSMVYVIWSDNRTPRGLYYKRSINGGMNWSDDTLLTQYTESFFYYYPEIVAVHETLHVVFMDRRGTNSEIYYKRSTNNGDAWSGDILLSDPDSASLRPDIAVSGEKVYVVWKNGFRRSLDGGETWQSVEYGAKGEAIAASGDMIHVVYTEYVNDTLQIFYQRYNGTSWEAPVQLTYSKGANFPDIAADGSNVYMIWSENIDGDSFEEEIFVKRSENYGVSWYPARRLTRAGTSGQGFYYPRILARDTVFAVWYGDRDEYLQYEVYFTYSVDSGKTWAPVFRVTRDSFLSELPAMAYSNGALHLVWDNLIGSGKEIFYRRRGRITEIQENISKISGIKVYPNPFNHNLAILVPADSKGVVEIYNVEGRKVRSLKEKVSLLVWDGSDSYGRRCPPGVYIIIYRSSKNTLKTRVVKCR